MNSATSRTTSKTAHDRLGVSLPRDLIERIRAEAEAANRPVSRQIAQIVRSHFKQVEQESNAA
jgi:hypothetical protein